MDDFTVCNVELMKHPEPIEKMLHYSGRVFRIVRKRNRKATSANSVVSLLASHEAIFIYVAFAPDEGAFYPRRECPRDSTLRGSGRFRYITQIRWYPFQLIRPYPPLRSGLLDDCAFGAIGMHCPVLWDRRHCETE